MFNLKIETAVGLFMAVALATFFYMTFKIGFFRLDRNKYHSYCICFTDASGLHKKADVKAFGIKVGWVDSLTLVSEQRQVCATIMILRECVLHSDSHATIRQEGLLGEKYLDIIPGTPTLPVLEPGKGSLRGQPDTASLDSLLGQVKASVSQVSTIASSVHDSFCTPHNKARAHEVMEQLGEASRNLAAVAQALSGLVARHETSVGTAVQALTGLIGDLSIQIPAIAGEVRELTRKLSDQVAPTLERTLEQASQSLDTHLARVSERCVAASEQVEQVARKVNEGKGTLSQLLNDEQLNQDIKGTVSKVKDTLSYFNNIRFASDTHIESMLGRAEHTNFNEFKTYLNLLVLPSQDHFYLAGLVQRQTGYIWREKIYGDMPRPEEKKHDFTSSPSPQRKSEMVVPVRYDQARIFDRWLWNLQFGKIIGNFAVRGGIFESTFGVGVDFCIPFKNDMFSWITSLEAWDLRGRLRINDDRPHLKWLNRVFVGENLYFVFGVDDFVSRHNSNFFLGAGFYFNDDDVGALFSYTPFYFNP